jgi:hypothetical protein
MTGIVLMQMWQLEAALMAALVLLATFQWLSQRLLRQDVTCARAERDALQLSGVHVSHIHGCLTEECVRVLPLFPCSLAYFP